MSTNVTGFVRVREFLNREILRYQCFRIENLSINKRNFARLTKNYFPIKKKLLLYLSNSLNHKKPVSMHIYSNSKETLKRVPLYFSEKLILCLLKN